eukprot:scaffold43157_cov51-Phaeocystis_antarctica.AAC.2
MTRPRDVASAIITSSAIALAALHSALNSCGSSSRSCACEAAVARAESPHALSALRSSFFCSVPAPAPCCFAGGVAAGVGRAPPASAGGGGREAGWGGLAGGLGLGLGSGLDAAGAVSSSSSSSSPPSSPSSLAAGYFKVMNFKRKKKRSSFERHTAHDPGRARNIRKVYRTHSPHFTGPKLVAIQTCSKITIKFELAGLLTPQTSAARGTAAVPPTRPKYASRHAARLAEPLAFGGLPRGQVVHAGHPHQRSRRHAAALQRPRLSPLRDGAKLCDGQPPVGGVLRHGRRRRGAARRWARGAHHAELRRWPPTRLARIRRRYQHHLQHTR